MVNHGRAWAYLSLLLLLVVAFMSVGSLWAQDATPEVTPEATQAIPCTVSTTVSKSISVRVGPGTNRTSFTFLPENQPFDVLGKAEAKDGSKWWKLDKQVVAPKKSAAEAWVAQTDVEAAGDCEAVIDVNAPPIIPIASGTVSGQPAGGDEIVPKEGLWTLRYPANVAGSCPGQNAASQNLNWKPESWNLTLSSDKTSINYATRTFIRISPNVYSGVTQLGWLNSTVSTRMTLLVRSATQIDVSLAFSYAAKGVACAYTVSARMTAD